MNEDINDFGSEIFRAGNWVLTEECIHWDSKKHYPYPILKERLWELRPDSDLDKFDWPLHIVDKSWQTNEDIFHFNTVFFFAVDYFKSEKPSSNTGSIWKTLEMQRRILELKKKSMKF